MIFFHKKILGTKDEFYYNLAEYHLHIPFYFWDIDIIDSMLDKFEKDFILLGFKIKSEGY